MVSIILPTFNEVENIKVIIPRIFETLGQYNIKCEVIVVDDNSPDGTGIVAQKMSKEYPVRVCIRRGEKGLATAVMKGFKLAKGEICVVMDADLSHPVEKIPEMIMPIMENRCDATVGSRYIKGGGCENWPLLRRIMSKGAGLLAKGVSSLSDPTSGFMAIRKSLLDNANIDPIGWKIVLEIIVKTNARVIEVPITFADRYKGKSKLDFRVQLAYLHHLWKLYCFKFPALEEFVKFCIVGTSGLIIDTAILVIFVELLSFDPRIAAIFAFLGAVSWNYLFNRNWTFKQKNIKIWYSYILFVVICLIGLTVRIGVMHLLIKYMGMGKRPWYILASVIGIGVGTIFNFLGSKYVAFSKSI